MGQRTGNTGRRLVCVTAIFLTPAAIMIVSLCLSLTVDPYLAAQYARNFVQGMQFDDDR